jgi:hypothetical protein
MIKKILTVGDSFTYGEELADIYQSWPYRLGELTGIEIINLGKPAASPDKIIRLALETVIQEPDIDLVIVSWPSPGRSEFSDEQGYYDVWPGYPGNLFARDGSTWRNNLVEYISMHHNDSDMHKKWIQNVLMLQGFFKSINKKCIMFNTVQNEHYKQTDFDNREQYYDLIDDKLFMGIRKSGMAEWTYGCLQGPGGHFLDDGHRIVAEKVNDYIRYLGWIS